MAFESSLKTRRSLVWETRGISKYQTDSPVFSLMDSYWMLKVIPVYQSGKLLATSFNIALKNCSGIQSFQTFDVVTFLEDRRNNVQMYCSKLTVSSSEETLFKAYFNSTYEKLPGFKLYDDLAIVCTFYPSTELSLISMKGPGLRIRHSLVWKTRKPTLYQKKEESPLFKLNNSKWKLEIHLASSTQDHNASYLISLRHSSGTYSLLPFEIETYLIDRRNFESIWCSRLNVSSTFENLYKASADSLYKKLPGLKLFNDVIIVCTFGPSIGSALSEKMENNITVSMEYPRNQDGLFQSNHAQCSSPNVSPHVLCLSDFENLSKDFGFLLKNSFMTDIQLECGEEIIAAHKAILAARSPVFSTVLKDEIVQNIITVEIKDMNPLVLQEFLGYLYCGKIPIDLPEDILCKLYKASYNYSVRGLKKLCSCYIAKSLNAENFIKFLIVAEEHDDLEMIGSIAGFIAEKPELLAKDMWLKFSDEFPRLANEIYRKYVVNVLKNK